MENGTSDSSDPSSFLAGIIGAPVVVKLNSSVVYKGLLQNVDGQVVAHCGFRIKLLICFRYMNISLEKTEEFVNGRLRRSYGEAFIRGNNGKQFRGF